MKLRDHPKMSHLDARNWPPTWARYQNGGTRKLGGEIGILTFIHCNDPITSTCYLAIDYQQETYVGAVTFSDWRFCRKFLDLLRNHIGRSINDIGDLELPETF